MGTDISGAAAARTPAAEALFSADEEGAGDTDDAADADSEESAENTADTGTDTAYTDANEAGVNFTSWYTLTIDGSTGGCNGVIVVSEADDIQVRGGVKTDDETTGELIVSGDIHVAGESLFMAGKALAANTISGITLYLAEAGDFTALSDFSLENAAVTGDDFDGDSARHVFRTMAELVLDESSTPDSDHLGLYHMVDPEGLEED